MIGIYKITNPSGRIYIGQSINIKRRYKTYINNTQTCKTSIKLYRSFMKYGVQNHIFEIMEECKVDLLNERERFWQEFYNATSDKNLNCLLTVTSVKKRNGRTLTDEQKKHLGSFHKGKINSEETRAKIKMARAKQIITEDHKRKISENSGSARIVLNTQTGIFYNSCKEAAEAHNINHNALICRLIGRIKKNHTNLIYV